MFHNCLLQKMEQIMVLMHYDGHWTPTSNYVEYKVAEILLPTFCIVSSASSVLSLGFRESVSKSSPPKVAF